MHVSGQITVSAINRFEKSESASKNHDSSQKILSVSLQDCFSRSSVKGEAQSGGLIGVADGNVVIQSCYAAGLHQGKAESQGGLIGEKTTDVSVETSYWDVESTEQVKSSGGEARLGSDMKFPFPAFSYTGWDFEDTWQRDTFGVNNGYPFLKNRTPENHSVTLVNNKPSSGRVEGGGNFGEFTAVRIKAIANPGYKFIGWRDVSGTIISPAPDFIHHTTSNDQTIYVDFAEAVYQLIPAVKPLGSGNVDGSGEYKSGEMVTLLARAYPGFVFRYWSDLDGTVLSFENPYKFTMPDEHLFITANFEIQSSIDLNRHIGFYIFPNPFNQELTVFIGESPCMISLTDISGKNMFNEIIYKTTNINTSAWPRGLYLASCIQEGKQKMIKLIKVD